jgi:hypothetical protein
LEKGELMKKAKKGYRIQVIQRGEEGPVRRVFEVDGFLLVTTDVDLHQTQALYTGGNIPMLTLGAAIAETCKGRNESFIEAMRGHAKIVFDAVMDDCKKAAKA